MATVVEVREGQVLIPHVLGDVLGLERRDRLMFEPDENGGLVSRYDRVRVLKRRIKRRVFEVVSCGEGTWGWTAAAPAWLPDGTYRIVSYEPRFLLMRSGGGDEAADRAAFWAKISDYHEHREHERQDHASTNFSRWFVEVVIDQLEPNRRILEVGCGAGRNLARILADVEGAEVVGVEINPKAAEVARQAVGDRGTIITASLYDLPDLDLGRFDIAFTAGVLMHIPHDEVESVVTNMATLAPRVVHFELHGVQREFDFHRYPRDYRALYQRLGLEGASYDVLERGDPANAGESSGQLALLTWPARQTPVGG